MEVHTGIAAWGLVPCASRSNQAAGIAVNRQAVPCRAWMRCAPALRNEGLPFADVLTEASIREVLNEHGLPYRNRVFSPVTTIWGFLSQVLSEDHSCRDAVSRIIAHRAANGITVCSPNTASYCNARSRIPTGVLSTLATRTAEELHTSVGDQWKWNGRSVFILDGSSVSMPDTPENQAMYPQPPQKPRYRVSSREDRGTAFAGDRCLPRFGHCAVRGQRHRRNKSLPTHVWHPQTR